MKIINTILPSDNGIPLGKETIFGEIIQVLLKVVQFYFWIFIWNSRNQVGDTNVIKEVLRKKIVMGGWENDEGKTWEHICGTELDDWGSKWCWGTCMVVAGDSEGCLYYWDVNTLFCLLLHLEIFGNILHIQK